MNRPAIQMNELGRALDDRGHARLADFVFAVASRLSPGWSAPWFNRGLIAKTRRNWEACRDHNLRAATLDSECAPAWWNLGIAATALGDWPLARRAWSSYGVDVPPGDGPLDLNLGAIPIRVAPETHGEVVWCRRLDPARAVIASVPLPECGRAYGDVVLNDGEPRGHRILSGRDVPVFDELELLAPSTFSTLRAVVIAPDRDAVTALESVADGDEIVIEDWSTVRKLCRACSEGTPHEHHAPAPSESPERHLGIAAMDEALARERLRQWAESGPGRVVTSVECVFAHDGRAAEPRRPVASMHGPRSR